MGSWFHASVKTVQRSQGHAPMTAKAAYRAAQKITDERTGIAYDYERRGGVLHSETVLPDLAPDWMQDRDALWNAAEAAERRKDSQVGRELEFSLPHDAPEQEWRQVAGEIAAYLVRTHGAAVDWHLHEPSRDGDERNFHVHMLFSGRRVGADGFTEKMKELDDKRLSGAAVEAIRAEVAAAINRSLERIGSAERVDHRSYERQGDEKEPTQHLGPAATQMERQGQPSRIAAANRKIRVFGEQRAGLRRDLAKIERSIRIEQGRNLHGIRRGPRPVDRPFNWTARDGVKEAAQRVRAITGEARAMQKAQHAAARTARRAELARFHAERRAIRDEISEKYEAAFHGIWGQRTGRGGDRHGSSLGASDQLAAAVMTPAVSPAASRMAVRINEQAARFRSNESTWRGRLANARAVAGDRVGLWRVIRLALNSGERLRLFDGQQRTLQATVRGDAPTMKVPPRPVTPEPQHILAARRSNALRAERIAELTAHDRETRAGAEAIKARHAEAMRLEQAERQALGNAVGQQWRNFRVAYGLPAEPKRPFNRVAEDRSAAESDRREAFEMLRERAALHAEARRAAAFRRIPAPALKTAGAEKAAPDLWQRGYSAADWRAHANQQEARDARERAERRETTPDPSGAFQHASTEPGEAIPIPPPAYPAHWGAGEIAAYERLAAQFAAEQAHEAAHEIDPGRSLVP